jgi:hypothetical protein
MEKGWVITVVLLALLMMGVLYNWLVGYLERTGSARGYVSFLVVAGVLFTLGGSVFTIGLENALLALASFGASGLPMIIGSMMRHAKARQEDEAVAKRLAQELLNDQEENGRVRYPAGINAGKER